MAAPRRLTPPGAASTEAGRVRDYRAEDLAAVVALRRRVFRQSERPGVGALEAYFERMFDRGPGGAVGLPSLVYEDAAGMVIGFQGVVERAMVFAGRPIRVAIGAQLMVAPEHRGFAGQALVRALFAGPQDLTVSDVGNEAARRLWKGLGGDHAPLHTFSWTETLRPIRHGANRLVAERNGWFVRASTFAVRPLVAVGDALVSGRSPRPKEGRVVPIDPTTMAFAADEVLGSYRLRPAYTPEGLAWLLIQLREKQAFGGLEGGMVRDAQDEVVGWFLYYRNRGGACEVIQVATRPRHYGLLLDHLAAHARARGGVSLTGRIDPAALPDLARRRVTLHHQGAWVLFHTPQPEIAATLREGGAYLSRLDAEWWMSF